MHFNKRLNFQHLLVSDSAPHILHLRPKIFYYFLCSVTFVHFYNESLRCRQLNIKLKFDLFWLCYSFNLKRRYYSLFRIVSNHTIALGSFEVCYRRIIYKPLELYCVNRIQLEIVDFAQYFVQQHELLLLSIDTLNRTILAFEQLKYNNHLICF